MKNVKGKVEAIKKELEKPIPEPQEKKMATKKKGGAKKKTTKKKTSAKRKTTAKKKSSKKTAASGVSLASLAKEAGISGQKARQKLRAAGVERTEGGRWNFTGKADLKAARKALDLK